MRVSPTGAPGRKRLLLGMATGTLLGLSGLWIVASGVLGLYLASPDEAVAAVTQAGDAAAGQEVYETRCSPCHGLEGDGNGAAARYLNPRPRDFTRGLFKLRTTDSGEVPLDEDLIQTVRKGIPGTAMPTWEGTLSGEDIQNVVAYIKNFAPDRFDPAFPPVVVDIGDPPSITQELVAQGKEVYDRVECWKCHGDGGRANGESAPTLEDDWGFRILPRNLNKGWQFKRGTSVEETYTRLSTGMDGSPMPSFIYELSEEERWAVSTYVNSLAQDEPEASEVVLRSKQIDGDLPTDPASPLWEQAKALNVPLTGQVVAAPRWQNISVDMLAVKSLHNGEEVAFLLTWDDPQKDTVHLVGQDDDLGLEDAYADWEVYGPRAETPERSLPSYRDAVALQLPLTDTQGPGRPHFLWGRANDPVRLWMWKADLQEQDDGASAVEEMRAKGHLVKIATGDEEATLTERMADLLEPQPPESQNVWGQGTWEDGTWRVVMRRALDTGDPQDAILQEGKLIPLSFQAWDGSNGERGLMMSISSWQFLLLETPTPANVYLYTLLGVLVAAVGEAGLVWRLRRRRR